MTNQAPDFSYRADMGFTHYELLNRLPSAVSPYGIRKISNLSYEIAADGRSVQLSMEAEETRKIASMTLPVTPIRLAFFNFDHDSHEKFMTRFKRYLHRGGG